MTSAPIFSSISLPRAQTYVEHEIFFQQALWALRAFVMSRHGRGRSQCAATLAQARALAKFRRWMSAVRPLEWWLMRIDAGDVATDGVAGGVATRGDHGGVVMGAAMGLDLALLNRLSCPKSGWIKLYWLRLCRLNSGWLGFCSSATTGFTSGALWGGGNRGGKRRRVIGAAADWLAEDRAGREPPHAAVL